MIRTIELSHRIAVQGAVVRRLRNGQVIIRDGRRHFIGTPVTR